MAMVTRKHDDGHDVTYYIHDHIKEKNLDKARDIVYNKNNSVVIIVDGKSGVGKSSLAIQIAKFLDPNFTIDNITWTPADFIDKAESLSKAALVFDEGMKINSRSALSKSNKAMIVALSQLRSRNLFIILCINSLFDLDRSIALHRADLLYHMYTKDDLIDGERRIKVYGRQKIKYLYIAGKKYYSYRSPPHFFARPPRKHVFLVNSKEYEKRKRKATKDNTDINGGIGKNELRYKTLLAQILSFIKTKGITQKMLAEEFDVIPQTFSRISVWATDNGVMER